MRTKGVTYDTGFVRHRAISRERFDPVVVERERPSSATTCIARGSVSPAVIQNGSS